MRTFDALPMTSAISILTFTILIQNVKCRDAEAFLREKFEAIFMKQTRN
jgi:low affinity Fe/Cu permease